MKKFMMTLVVLCAALSVNAQVYLGGSLGLNTVSQNEGDDQTSFKILPEIGYKFNENWAIGSVIGYQKGTYDMQSNPKLGSNDSYKAFSFEPYARYTFVNSKLVSVFLDMGFGITSGENHNNDFTAFNVGVRPGVAVNLNKHFSFVTKVGFLGYNEVNPKDGKKSHSFGLDLDGNNLTFGLYYNF